MNEEFKPSEADSGASDKSGVRTPPPGIVLAVLVTVGLVFFVVQNNDEVSFAWLFFDMTGPLWVVIVVAAIAGAALSSLLGWLRRRRR